MKIGFRKPSLKKSFKARTTGRIKRSFKKSINPFYGKKGMGWLNPKKKIYNSIYRKTTIDPLNFLRKAIKTNIKVKKVIRPRKKFVIVKYFFGILFITAGLTLIIENILSSLLGIFIGLLFVRWGNKSKKENSYIK